MEDRTRSRGLSGVPAGAYAAATAAILALQAAVLHLMGRIAICKCGYVTLWHGGANDSGTSQHLADPYSFTHIVHGIMFYALLRLLAPRLPARARFVLAVLVEAAWEVLENTPTIINRYRAATMSLDYFGDSIVNSLADVLFCAAGFAIASKLPTRATIAFAAAIELALALSIRDNLTLNLIMLVWPLEAIRRWQLAGGVM